jgi:hypothetical protein
VLPLLLAVEYDQKPHFCPFFPFFGVKTMSNCTITFHLGTTLSQAHNVRDPKVTSKEPHIDPNGSHETLIHEDVEDAYKRLFDDALHEYNAKQKKPSRRIASYYEHIKGSKEHHTCYEAIIGLYGKDEYGKESISAIERTVCTRLLKEYLTQFQAQNPQLHVIGAYIHADEEGKYPHMHLDFIPVAQGNKNGLSKKVSLKGALQQQFKSTNFKFSATAQEAWCEIQRKNLQELAQAQGHHVLTGVSGGRKHVHTKLFKAEINNVKKQVDTKLAIHQELLDEVAEAPKIEAKKNFFGSGYTISAQQYQKLSTVQAVAQVASQKLKKIEKTHNGEALKSALEELEHQKKMLNSKNKALIELQEGLKTEKKLRFLKEQENKKLALELQKTEHSFRQIQEVLKTAVKWIELVMTSLKPEVQKNIKEFITRISEAGFVRKSKTRSR